MKTTPENTSSSKAVAAHTPGPWHVDPRATLRVVSEGNNTIASTGTTDTLRDQWESNARLISAAPELYEALRNLLALSRPHFSDSTQILALNLAEQAIAKAEGSL